MNANLMLHCGAHAVPRAALESVSTPAPTQTWQPVPHLDVVQRVTEAMPRYGLTVVNEAHALTHDASRYFGLLELRNGHDISDLAWVLGIRNSHDMSLPAGLVAGTSVFVCDNLAFIGSIKVTRKHTRFIVRDLPMLIDRAISRLVGRWHEQEARVHAYKEHRLTNLRAHDLVIKAFDAGACTNRQIPEILREWRTPSHDAFLPRSLWSFVNAGTEVMKGSSLPLLAARTERLHVVCDRAVGLDANVA